MPDDKPTTMYADLIAAQKAFPSIRKDNTADTGKFKYKYADLGDILDAVKPVLHEHNFALVQATDLDETGDLIVVTKLYHVSGEAILGVYPVRCVDPNDPQKVGGALTYARRYALMAMLGLAAEDDDAQMVSRATTSRTAAHQTRQHEAEGTTNRAVPAQEREPDAKDRATPNSMDDRQRAAIFGLGGKLGLSQDEIKSIAYERFNVDSMTKLSYSQAGAMIAYLQDEKQKLDAAPLGISESERERGQRRAAELTMS